jgi:predicted transcriptional regulator
MDKIISARIDETAANQIGDLARRLHTSKKCVLESALAMYAAHVGREEDTDVFEKTCGAWHRKEPAAQLVKTARQAFRDSMERRQR